MEIIITRKIGDSQLSFKVNEPTDILALEKAGHLTSMPNQCGLCKSDKVYLYSNKAQNYTFIQIVCRDCKAKSQLGQYKTGGFYWKDWEKFQFNTFTKDNAINNDVQTMIDRIEHPDKYQTNLDKLKEAGFNNLPTNAYPCL